MRTGSVNSSSSFEVRERLITLYRRLLELEEPGRTIQVGLVAAGTFGTQIVSQMAHAAGMRIAVIAELDAGKALRALGHGGSAGDQVAIAETPEDIDAAISAGRPAVTASAQAVMESGVDVVVEATGNVKAGATHARRAIGHGEHVVMVAVEADVVVGLQLKRLADEAGVLCGAAYGDEPALAFELWDWARALGFRPQHWVGHEMPVSVARMMLNRETCGSPIGQFAEVVAAAKKPLPAGTVLDGEGGYCVHGLLEKAAVAREENLLPVGLSQGAVVTLEIREGGLVTFDDVEVPDSEVLELRRIQDSVSAGSPASS